MTDNPIDLIKQAIETIKNSNGCNPELRLVMSSKEFELYSEFIQKKHPKLFQPSIYDDYSFKHDKCKCMFKRWAESVFSIPKPKPESMVLSEPMYEFFKDLDIIEKDNQ